MFTADSNLSAQRPQGYEVVLSKMPAELMEISAFCSDVDCRKVLVRGPSTRVALSVAEIFSLGQEIAKLALKIAVVEWHDASGREVRFLEDVTTNRGSSLQFFDDVQEAKKWLGAE